MSRKTVLALTRLHVIAGFLELFSFRDLGRWSYEHEICIDFPDFWFSSHVLTPKSYTKHTK